MSSSLKYAMVFPRPTLTGTLGDHPSISFAKLMSGLRCFGSSSVEERNSTVELDPVISFTKRAKFLTVKSKLEPGLSSFEKTRFCKREGSAICTDSNFKTPVNRFALEARSSPVPDRR